LEKILNETGFSNIWQTQTFKSIEWLKQSIKQTLLDQFLQDWNSSVHNSPKETNYRIFKTDFKFEEYFNILDVNVCVCHILEKPVSFNIFSKNFIHLISKFCYEYK
jgi:hypothetical protein